MARNLRKLENKAKLNSLIHPRLMWSPIQFNTKWDKNFIIQKRLDSQKIIRRKSKGKNHRGEKYRGTIGALIRRWLKRKYNFTAIWLNGGDKISSQVQLSCQYYAKVLHISFKLVLCTLEVGRYWAFVIFWSIDKSLDFPQFISNFPRFGVWKKANNNWNQFWAIIQPAKPYLSTSDNSH